MTFTWILDKHVDRVKGKSTPFIELANERGHIVYGLRDSLIPQAIDLTGITPSAITFVRGSHGFVNFVERELTPFPGGFLHPTNFLFTTFIPILKNLCINHVYQIVEYGEFTRKRDIFKGRIFIKPLENLKLFNGLMLEDQEDMGSAHYAKYRKWSVPHENCKLVVSPATTIEQEYRIVMVDGEPITGSTYDGNNSDVPDAIIDLALWNPSWTRWKRSMDTEGESAVQRPRL